MTPYLSIVRARFRVLLQYRARALAGFGTQLFWGLIRMMLFDAFYQYSTAPQPMSYPQVVTYLWLTQALLWLLPFAIDWEIRTMIWNGDVVYELVRPTDLYWFWFCRNLAFHAAPALLRSAPMFVMAGLFFGLQPPASLASAAAWAASIVGAMLLSCAILNLVCISLLWTISGDGIRRLVGASAAVFSGAIVPLPLFLEWAQPVLNFLPFRGLMDVPFRLYIGHMPAHEVIGLLAHQLAWTIALVLIGRLSLHIGMRRLVVQGG